jgi:hypothetical protein
MRPAVPIALAIVVTALLAGCGDSSSSEDDSTSGGTRGAPAGASATSCATDAVDAETLRATAVSCEEARGVLFAWQRASSCAGSPGASHSACTVRSYRCTGSRTERGLTVSCARPGRSIAFIVRD